MLELLMSHEFFTPTSHRLHMVDNQLVQVCIGMVGIDYQLISNVLAGGIRCWIGDI
jgi:hypothetical protein